MDIILLVKKSTQPDRIWRIISLLIVCNFLLWNIIFPVLEPPDESGHYTHARAFALTWNVPNLRDRPGKLGFTQYPPAYYALLSPLVYLFQSPDFYAYDQLQYHPLASEYKKTIFSIYQHSRGEMWFQWNQLMLSVHAMRLATSLLGLLTIGLVFKTARLVFGQRSYFPHIAAIGVGFNPMFAHISTALTNLNLLVLLFSLFLYLTVKWLKPGSNSNYFLLGLICGLAVVTKVTGLLLMPLGILFLLIKRSPIKKFPRAATLFLAGMLVFSGWYFALNIKRYGSLVPLKEMLLIVNRDTLENVRMQDMGVLNYWFRFPITMTKTMFSGYGSSIVHLPRWVLWGAMVSALVGLWGIAYWLADEVKKIRQRKPLKLQEKRSLYLAISLGLIFLSHLRVNVSMEAFHGKDMFPSVVPLSILVVVGLRTFYRRLAERQLAHHFCINTAILMVFAAAVFVFTQQVQIVRQLKQEDVTWPRLLIAAAAISGSLSLSWLAIKGSFVRRAATKLHRAFELHEQLIIVATGATGLVINVAILALLIVPKFYR